MGCLIILQSKVEKPHKSLEEQKKIIKNVPIDSFQMKGTLSICIWESYLERDRSDLKGRNSLFTVSQLTASKD